MSTIVDILKTMDYGLAPESDADVRAWLAGHKDGFKHFIDGAFVAGKGKGTIVVVAPADESEIATVPIGTGQDVTAAVTAARGAFGKWSRLSGHERARYLYAIARHLQKRERFFAVLESIDNGKPIRETRDIDIPLVARHFYYHAGWAELAESEFSGYSPVGVCGQIIPWNFPLLMLAWKVAPALAAGNTVVLKPAEETPLTAAAFAELCVEIGLPAGVINIVHGDGATGAELVTHADVDKLAFTGSTEVGRKIRAATAGSGKKLSLELGGKSPFIVFEDADLDAAVEGVVDAIWFNQGEVCCAGSRILVQEGIAEEFYRRLTVRMETLRVGDPLDKSIDIGAIISRRQLERIASLVDSGRAEGGALHQASMMLPDKGTFMAPGFFTDVAPSSLVCQEEIFGPIAVAMTFRTPAEAIQLANDTRHGLAASIWSENINQALEAAAGVKAGVVWINATNLFDAAAGFGGYRESGFGREGGREGFAEYMVANWEKKLPTAKDAEPFKPTAAPATAKASTSSTIDRTAKMYIGGKQVRADGGASYSVAGKGGTIIGAAGLGNRKDVRNAVEAAANAGAWSTATAHNRAQVLYYLAENLASRGGEIQALIARGIGGSTKAAKDEFEAAIRRIFFYAAQADKFDGRVHSTKSRHLTLAMHEPWGVVGVVCPDAMPLLSWLSMALPLLAVGNRVVTIPSTRHPLIATSLYQVLDTSDVPAGVVNIITGERDLLAKTLAEHDGAAAIWYAGSKQGSAMVEHASAGNLKATWVDNGRPRNWLDPAEGQGRDYLARAVQVKNIWAPYGE